MNLRLLNSATRAYSGSQTPNDIKSLAIPSISTGIYHYRIDQASKIALDVARRNDRLSLAITFVCFDEPTYLAYQKAMSD